MTSYQKLKEENKKMRRHIHLLITNPECDGAIVLRMMYKTKFSLENLVWFGSTENNISPNKNQQS